MTLPLENLSGPGKSLQKEPPDAKEFTGLKRSGLARLSDAANTANSLEGRFDLAYNAAHALCLAALRWHGYPAGQPLHRVSGVAAHARFGTGGLARTGQVS
jgi:hypothetical protein